MPNPYAAIPSYEDVYGGEYFSPADLHDGPVTAKIVNLEYTELFCRGVGKNFKIVLTLDGQKKKVCVNKTSAKALAFAFSKDFQKWKGQTIAATGGEVNGKAAVLLKPVKARGSVPIASSTATAALPLDQPAGVDGNGTTPTRSASLSASKEDAWKACLESCGGDHGQATPLWHKLNRQHRDNYDAMIAQCKLPI